MTLEITGYFVCDTATGEWRHEPGPERMAGYWVDVRELLADPGATIEWLAHLSGKSWFKPERFFAFLRAFREQNKIYDYFGAPKPTGSV